MHKQLYKVLQIPDSPADRKTYTAQLCVRSCAQLLIADQIYASFSLFPCKS